MKKETTFNFYIINDILSNIFIGLTSTFILLLFFLYLKSSFEKRKVYKVMTLVSFIKLCVFFFSPFFYKSKKLNNKEEYLELTKIAWACDCANWATAADLSKYSDNQNDSLVHLCIYIEPADHSLEIPDSIGYRNDQIQFFGSFYRENGFPAFYKSFQNPNSARVFRYTKYKVIKSN